MTHAITLNEQSTKPAASARPARRASAAALSRGTNAHPLSFMSTKRGTTTRWTAVESLPDCYPEIADAAVRDWHRAFFVGRQRAAEYALHVKRGGQVAQSLTWVVGDMPIEVLASMSLSAPASKRRAQDPVQRGLVAGFFHGMAELAAGLVGPGDIAWDAVLMDASVAGKLLPGSTPVHGESPVPADADGGANAVLHSARPKA